MPFFVPQAKRTLPPEDLTRDEPAAKRYKKGSPSFSDAVEEDALLAVLNETEAKMATPAVDPKDASFQTALAAQQQAMARFAAMKTEQKKPTVAPLSRAGSAPSRSAASAAAASAASLSSAALQSRQRPPFAAGAGSGTGSGGSTRSASFPAGSSRLPPGAAAAAASSSAARASGSASNRSPTFGSPRGAQVDKDAALARELQRQFAEEDDRRVAQQMQEAARAAAALPAAFGATGGGGGGFGCL